MSADFSILRWMRGGYALNLLCLHALGFECYFDVYMSQGVVKLSSVRWAETHIGVENRVRCWHLIVLI